MILHDITNILQRLELMAKILAKKDFGEFSREEVESDVKEDLKKLERYFKELSSGQ